MKAGRQPGMKRLAFLATVVVSLAGSARATTFYVDGVNGNDNWDGLCEEWDGGTCGPKKTIQAGINVSADGDEVRVADAVYTGNGNRNLIYVGKEITVRSAGGPANCIIDINHADDPAFKFQYGETAYSVLDGLTIINCDAC